MGGFSPSSTKILQRTLLAAVPALLIFSLLPTGFAQSNGKKTSKGPRAVAVVEWTPSGPHLIPVSILVDGKFYDAGLYLANPVPMALEPGNIYEIQKSGDPAGLFTVNSAMELQASNTFYGVGKITSQADVEAANKRAAAAKAAAAARAPSRLSSEDSGPPRLRRAGGHGGHSGSPGGSPTSGPSTPQPPTQPPSSTPDSTGGDDDPDRPTMKRSEPPPAAPTAAPASTTASSAPPADDSDRPVLKRGSQGQQAASLTGPAVPKAGTPSASGTAAPTAARNRIEVAVSDPNATQLHPFKWIGKPEYEQRDQESTRQLALQAVRDYAAKHPGLRASSVTDDLEVHAFDLDYTNTPLFVLTATVPQASAPTPKARTPKPKAVAAQEPVPGAPKNEFYVTVVARENYDGTMRKVFVSVTDNTHLDVYPRLELIDVVDADGSGRGELLFRQISDTSRSWVIYRVGVETMTALYNGGAPLEQ
jgi:hypothetical protein